MNEHGSNTSHLSGNPFGCNDVELKQRNLLPQGYGNPYTHDPNKNNPFNQVVASYSNKWIHNQQSDDENNVNSQLPYRKKPSNIKSQFANGKNKYKCKSKIQFEDDTSSIDGEDDVLDSSDSIIQPTQTSTPKSNRQGSKKQIGSINRSRCKSKDVVNSKGKGNKKGNNSKRRRWREYCRLQ